ncbi:MAG: arginine--tRNA ligase [Lachnospiraceae bacterium]|nr:arginine--tRNA ligase [Lachnospiraceae bacterium]
MKNILEILSEELVKAFEKAGYDTEFAKASVSNRPDLCQFQCNGAMALAKKYKKAPIMIANEVKDAIVSEYICDLEAVAPGFLNFNINGEKLAEYLADMAAAEDYGINKEKNKKKIVIDYGGPNVAKPLHVGHLRSAIIGESVKRICRFMNNEVIGDIHLGDWGLQMGLIITELKLRQPDLPYFDDNFTGEYPEEAPFTISELEEIYPTASKKTKETEADGKTLTQAAVEYKAAAMEATFKLQNGDRGYRAIWNHIMSVSVADLKKNYKTLNVDFDWWKGESDVQDDIAPMVEEMKKAGFAYESEGALVVDVARETDTKEVPPCMILKSDGAALYTTTDLATLKQRRSIFDPDRVIYVVDKRQEMHFTQVFRCAEKTGVVKDGMELDFIGFGTMNGKDGKPFKTRDGGVMRLEHLLKDIQEEMFKKITGNHDIDPDEAKEISEIVGLAAVKYGDLSNQATKDYIFDIDKFTSFEGNTGPYILYTIVRIKSILNKFKEMGGADNTKLLPAATATEKALSLELTKLHTMMSQAYTELAPHKICAYIYDVANVFNSFYHENKILKEEDKARQESFIELLKITKGVLELCIDLLGFSAPEHM